MILVAGAAGFVGHALLDEFRRFEGAHPPVRALVRSEFDAVRLRDQGHEAVAADLVTRRGLHEAMQGVDTVVYLVHTIDRGNDVIASDLEAVQNAMLAARLAGVRRVVFLGCVGSSEASLSTYLLSRWAVELAVRQSGLRTVVLRSSLIVGRGGTLFEMMRRLVDRSPVVPLFAWRRIAVEPVALARRHRGAAHRDPRRGVRRPLVRHLRRGAHDLRRRRARLGSRAGQDAALPPASRPRRAGQRARRVDARPPAEARDAPAPRDAARAPGLP